MRHKRLQDGNIHMETKDLSLFLAIARIQSISRTAEQLFMSQSTVTTRLQRLEHALGYSLFQRNSSGVRLTREGELLLPLAEKITQLEQQMYNPGDEEVPVLRIMSGRAFVSTDVPECLHRMSARSSVHFQVRMGLYDEMKDALLAQQADFCFLGEAIYHPDIELVEYPPDAIDLIVPVEHYLIHVFENIRQIASEPFIAFGRPTSPFRRRVMNLLAKAEVYPAIPMELDSIDGVKAMVAHGLGLSLLPRRTLFDASVKGFRSIPLKEHGWTRPTYVAYPKALSNQPLVNEFLQVTDQIYTRLS